MLKFKLEGGKCDGHEGEMENEVIGFDVMIDGAIHEYTYSYFKDGIYYFIPLVPLGIKAELYKFDKDGGMTKIREDMI